MKRITLPGTDLLVSRLSLGTASLHHLPTSSQRQALLAAAFEQGFTHLDTAPYYGFGLAEQEVGRFLKSRGDALTVASKMGLYPPGGPSSTLAAVWVRKALGKLAPVFSRPVVDWSIAAATQSLEQSLRRLQRDQVDILFLHEPTPGLLDAEEFLRWFERQREQGKLRYWGLAGPAERFATWVREGHGLARVLQVRDRAGTRDDHPVLAAGRAFQFTYGYLAAARAGKEHLPVGEVLCAALSRNPIGSVLVSTRRIAHLPELVAAVESQ